ncbi:conjugal transfer protein TraF [Helicobacter kayseriensis]|uniref:conjugal transfer protein TraF n=1 Tax=Helicobacter kayseriensis TaxID=2905877 RepID=UPI001E46D1E9|nr:conjugal transfer protein TraF [Helicobacter kayseriensis]MCE3047031.1 conjugal transfer protein TraF [Helicobacter kayseriensis]MCE3048309.1 conjugal transfer protein TraF [Helicobacter kayseriensis]
MKKITLFLSLSYGLFALSFGGMGNTSAGLGNSGVALRKSAWGIYYNPALLASDNRGKFGYSFGIEAKEKGLEDIVSIFLNQGTNNIQEIYDRFQSRPTHSLSLSSQNGIVIQITGGEHKVPKLNQEGIPTGEMIEKRNPYGAFTMASFLSVYGSGDITATLQDKTIQAQGLLSSVALIEVPIGWGWRFETNGGDVSIGASIKYMGAMGIHSSISASITETNYALSTTAPQNLHLSHWFGIDLGILYSPIESVHLGLVAKNINVPSFDLLGQKFKILPQVRFGISYEFAKYFALTFDADLTPNSFLFENSPKTQMLGGGLLMDFKYIDLRFGLMGDMANKFEEGVIMTGGINLLGFLDLAIQASSKMFEAKSYKIPHFISAKIGGSFTF